MREFTPQPGAVKLGSLAAMGYRPPAPGAYSRARNAASGCCIPAATARSRSVPPQRVEDLSVQTFLSQLSIKTFAGSVLPRTARFDVQGSRPQICQPLAQFPGDEFRAIIGTNAFRHPSPQHHLRQRLDSLCLPRDNGVSVSAFEASTPEKKLLV